MKHPAEDLEARTPVWDILQELFVDSDPEIMLGRMADVCAASPYDVDELEEILFQEVLPTCRGNGWYGIDPVPPYVGASQEQIVKRVLKKHRFGKRRPFVMRAYTREWWDRLKPLIEARRAG
jgi:hypothetical protein